MKYFRYTFSFLTVIFGLLGFLSIISNEVALPATVICLEITLCVYIKELFDDRLKRDAYFMILLAMFTIIIATYYFIYITY